MIQQNLEELISRDELIAAYIREVSNLSIERDFTNEEIQNLIAFAGLLSPAWAVLLWTSLVDRPGKRKENLKKFHGALADIVMDAVDIHEQPGVAAELEAERTRLKEVYRDVLPADALSAS